MEHFHQKSAILIFINFAEYPHLAFLTNDSLVVNYITYNPVCLTRTVEALTVYFAYITSTRRLWRGSLPFSHDPFSFLGPSSSCH